MKREHAVHNQEHWKLKQNEQMNMIYSQKRLKETQNEEMTRIMNSMKKGTHTRW